MLCDSITQHSEKYQQKMNYNLSILENFLNEHQIPIVKKKPLTFLGISKQPHYENVWSNIYAFFFNTIEEHNLNDLFINSLLELINENIDSKFNLKSPFDIETEVGTNNNGRIDVLLSNNNDAIIIENKVYHHLNNDLEDYWNSISQTNKIGIILSLHKVPKTQLINTKFIGITHLELLQKVVSNLSNYFSTANEKYIIFLKDFYQNVINTTNPMDTDIIKFFYRNQEEINQISEVKSSFVSFVISEVEKARINIDEKLEPYGSRNESFRYYLCPNQGNLMITIVFGELFTEKRELLFIIELQNELLNQKEKIQTIEFDDKEKEYLKTDFFNQKGSWAHFAIQVVRPTENDIINLNNYISETINNSPIIDIYKKIKAKLVDEI